MSNRVAVGAFGRDGRGGGGTGHGCEGGETLNRVVVVCWGVKVRNDRR